MVRRMFIFFFGLVVSLLMYRVDPSVLNFGLVGVFSGYLLYTVSEIGKEITSDLRATRNASLILSDIFDLGLNETYTIESNSFGTTTIRRVA